MLEAAQKAMLESKGAAKAVAQQLNLPFRSVKKAFYPGDVAKRLQRAEAQGFDVLNPLSHGGSREYFDINAPQPIFLTPNKGSALSYAKHSTEGDGAEIVLPFFMHKDARVLDTTRAPGSMSGRIYNPEKVLKFLQEARATPRGPNGVFKGVEPEFIEQNYNGSDIWQLLENEGGYRDAREVGFDSVKIRDTDWDGDAHIAHRVMNPNAIRSSFADFNPRYAKALRKSERVPTWLAGLGITAGAPLLSDSK